MFIANPKMFFLNIANILTQKWLPKYTGLKIYPYYSPLLNARVEDLSLE
jgi:hypothetical protein